MSTKTLIIFQNKSLYNILNEISINFNFNVIFSDSNNINYHEYEDYLIITNDKQSKEKNKILLTEFPLRFQKLLKIININFLKNKYHLQSRIVVGKYELDLNSKMLSKNNNFLDLTEMESKVILFLKKKEKPTNIKELQKKVWGHMPDLETHTVETHIYRLRKKILKTFNDNKFIVSKKNGYQIK